MISFTKGINLYWAVAYTTCYINHEIYTVFEEHNIFLRWSIIFQLIRFLVILWYQLFYLMFECTSKAWCFSFSFLFYKRKKRRKFKFNHKMYKNFVQLELIFIHIISFKNLIRGILEVTILFWFYFSLFLCLL